jgi:hypothetical protein
VVGDLAALLFLIKATEIFCLTALNPLTSPLPFFAYPLLVATFAGWSWALPRGDRPGVAEG